MVDLPFPGIEVLATLSRRGAEAVRGRAPWGGGFGAPDKRPEGGDRPVGGHWIWPTSCGPGSRPRAASVILISGGIAFDPKLSIQ